MGCPGGSTWHWGLSLKKRFRKCFALFSTFFARRSAQVQPPIWLRPKMMNAFGEPKAFTTPICSRRTALLREIPSCNASQIPLVMHCTKEFFLRRLPAEIKSWNRAEAGRLYGQHRKKIAGHRSGCILVSQPMTSEKMAIHWR